MRSGQEWQDFLQTEGAVQVDGEVSHFGDPVLERRAAGEGDIIADLSHLALISAGGEDAGSFLQGQLSNDIRLVSATHSKIAGYCTPQGRMLAIFRIFMRDGTYFLQVPASLLEPTLKRLRMFVLRAKVRLDDAGGSWMRIGVSGPGTPAALSAEGLVPPDTADACATDRGVTVLRIAGPVPRFELIAAGEVMAPLWKRLRTRLTAVGAGVWSWLDIAAAIPTVLPQTLEQFVPQMANLDLVGGISFNKGCYPGQEIVARMHYLGRLKQRMVRARVDTGTQPGPGAPVYAPDFTGQSAGTVVDARPAPEGGFDVLAVIQLSSIHNGELKLDSPAGRALRLLPMPYTIEPDPAASKR